MSKENLVSVLELYMKHCFAEQNDRKGPFALFQQRHTENPRFTPSTFVFREIVV